jgi:hypothetical protein
MSTTFAIRTKDMYSGVTYEVEIARHSGHHLGEPVKIEWLNSVAPFLKKKMKVYPTDNNCQGVDDIGDLRKLYKNYMEDQTTQFLKKVDTLTQLRSRG